MYNVIAIVTLPSLTSQGISLFAMSFIFRGLHLIYPCCHGNEIWHLLNVWATLSP